jgi:hypothetical protein
MFIENPHTPVAIINAMRRIDQLTDEERIQQLLLCADSLRNMAEDLVAEKMAANWDDKSGWTRTYAAAVMGVSRQALSQSRRIRQALEKRCPGRKSARSTLA